MKPTWTAFEHQIYKTLKDKVLTSVNQQQNWLVALSGGSDSVLLLTVLSHLQSALNVKIEACHVHHGIDVQDRDEGLRYSVQLCQNLGVPLWISNWTAGASPSGKVLKSEADFREFRWQELRHWQTIRSANFVVTAHHQQDQLETRLLKLFRGVGKTAISAMSFSGDGILRPFLDVEKTAIENEISLQKIQYWEDPSNQQAHYLRNWLRNQWLPQLEAKMPGGLKVFNRSLEQIIKDTPNNALTADINFSEGFDLLFYRTLAPNEQRRMLALFMKHIGVNDFRHSQIIEMQRQLDISKKEHTFRLAGLTWKINAKRLEPTPSQC